MLLADVLLMLGTLLHSAWYASPEGITHNVSSPKQCSKLCSELLLVKLLLSGFVAGTENFECVSE